MKQKFKKISCPDTSPTSSTCPVGCPSLMWVDLIELMMSAATEVLCLDQLVIHTQRRGRVVKRVRQGLRVGGGQINAEDLLENL